jgi:peroxiredoxin Q/BCP
MPAALWRQREDATMRWLIVTMTVLAGLGAAAFAAGEKNSAKELQAGDPAPKFSLPGSDGKTYSLEDYLDKRAVVVAWFPKAFTGG